MTIPHWPGMMTKRTALAYLDLTEVQFAREIAAGAGITRAMTRTHLEPRASL